MKCNMEQPAHEASGNPWRREFRRLVRGWAMILDRLFVLFLKKKKTSSSHLNGQDNSGRTCSWAHL